MIVISASKARRNLAAILRRVLGGERFVLLSRGKPAGAIVSVEDLDLLRALEDRVDLIEARRSLALAESGETVPWEDLKGTLGL